MGYIPDEWFLAAKTFPRMRDGISYVKWVNLTFLHHLVAGAHSF